MLDDVLKQYINDCENPEVNYALGLEYESIGQTGAASSFFLRASERTDDDLLAYECILKMGNCFLSQGKRYYSVKTCYYRAISILPTRPEAYFLLSRLEEWEKQYFQSYTIAKIGYSICDFESEPLRSDVQYVGKYGLLFEQAVCSWWWGNTEESKSLFRKLVDEHWNDMDDQHRSSVEGNIARLGSGPESQAFTHYQKDDYENLRFKFKDSEKIDKNFSQVYQDMFVLSMLNGKKNGTYVEVGGGRPYEGNNTTLLEFNYGWKGVSLETNEDFVSEYRRERNNPILCKNALTINYKKMFEEHFQTKEIDYLQLDIEPAKNTFECLLSIPFDEYKFAVITYEHDYYVDITRSYRDKSRKYLKMYGYELVVSDVSPDGISTFEDWWVHPDLVDPKIIKIMKDISDQTKKAKTYILNQDDKA